MIKTLIIVALSMLLVSCSVTSTPSRVSSVPPPSPAETAENDVEIKTTFMEKGTWRVSITCKLAAENRAEALKQASVIILSYSKEVPTATPKGPVPAEEPLKAKKPDSQVF